VPFHYNRSLGEGQGADSLVRGPPFADGESGLFLSVNRNKQSVALYARHKTGQGQHVLTSLMAANLALQATRIAEYFSQGVEPPCLGHAVSNHRIRRLPRKFYTWLPQVRR
jgi:crotonobetainyl-CoA:carnitine CoA-transferase CaiB-like acyl-CoA transferase